jgi:hypothetical protein
VAIGWLTVLKSVPWSDVISNAPVVVDGAKKLWGTVSRQPVRQAPAAPAHSPASQTLEGRIGALEATLTEQRAQLVASSELIKALADQNAQLISRIDTHRRVMVWLALAAAVATLAGASGLWLHITR